MKTAYEEGLAGKLLSGYHGYRQYQGIVCMQNNQIFWKKILTLCQMYSQPKNALSTKADF